MTVLSSIKSKRKSISKSRSRSRSNRKHRNKNNNKNDNKNENKNNNKNNHHEMEIDSDDLSECSSPSTSISLITLPSDLNTECHSNIVIGDNQENDNEYDEYYDAEDVENEENENKDHMEEPRLFTFNIENDENLQNLINNNLTDDIPDEFISNNDMELTSDYILSKLYNYMKISEMSKYGISVFQMTFSSYLPFLSESDLIKLSTSYWCNGQHFKCMISHRGDIIKSESDESDNNNILQLAITGDLLDAAMQSGASVDKIEAMLLQKRIDDGIINKQKIYHTPNEKKFYVRNLKHRFWNHEVLVRVFIQNQWLTPPLAMIAMRTFIKTIYHRVLQSKSVSNNNKNNNNNIRHKRDGGDIKFSENFLHSFFVSYFCLDDIPKMYKQEIIQKYKHYNNDNTNYVNQISEETLRRWCELIELLASRGANINEYEFRKIIPLQYALQIGRNTHKFITSSHKNKNQLLIPNQYQKENITVPNVIWDVLVSYL